ncbi:ATP-binding cassette domain-containing protein [Actinorugispora endophytica]|uniref:ABC-type multidrug transport system ATPase subunit n=1 Tax=Actinorugispora endophytica TaxID=1605990 RepID=A0A4R6V0Q9_9ACTN|nr:ATP-binding cassette domain-containing protein [Actinorugispora endophytica]TDQ49584.1 ABC-type multidrug transport system ATPase subunit [Actinorugispora endophytica]
MTTWPSPSGIVVSARGLTKHYGDRAALNRIDLDLGRGVTGLLGRNGAGKTTLLRCLATAHDPDSGSLEVLGHDPTTAPGRARVRAQLGFLPQNPVFYPNFTAFTLLDYIAILKEVGGRRARHDEVRRVLDQVGLTDRRHTRVRRLSGGMRQRLGLAGALLGEPGLLLLDEPTIGLDPEQRIRFRDLVSEFAATRAVVLSTHQTEDVAAVCDRVVVLDEGLVVFADTPAALTDRARGRVWSLPERPSTGSTSWRSPDGRYRVLTPHGAEPPAGYGGIAEPLEPTLEDGYLLVTGSAEGTVAA